MSIPDPRLDFADQQSRPGFAVLEPFLEGAKEAEIRVRAVLSTPPGRLPWRPDFGCPLEDLLGRPATKEILERVRLRIRTALKKWTPDLEVDSCEVREVPAPGSRALDNLRPRERAWLQPSRNQVRLEVEVVLQLPNGRLRLTATIARGGK